MRFCTMERNSSLPSTQFIIHSLMCTANSTSSHSAGPGPFTHVLCTSETHWLHYLVVAIGAVELQPRCIHKRRHAVLHLPTARLQGRPYHAPAHRFWRVENK